MDIIELYPAVQALQHADKIRLMQFLISEFAREEKITLEKTPQKKSIQPIDALQTLANMAQPLGDENLARNFKDYTRQIIDNETGR